MSAAGAARGFAAFKQRPFVHLFSFGALHVGLAWALIPPIYLFLHQTNSATALLAGPQAAYVLSRKVPAWVPLPGDHHTGSLQAAADQKAGIVDAVADGKAGSERTVEDVLEAILKQSIAAGYQGGKSVLSSARSLTAQLSQLGGLDKHDTEEAEQRVSDALKDVTGGHGRSAASKIKSMAGGAWDSTIGKRARDTADDLKYAQIRDAVAAWVLVKALLPVRLPISVFLTPRVVRGLSRVFAKAA